MNLSVRNAILLLLFLVVQYQLWFSNHGYLLTKNLTSEIQSLSNYYQRMIRSIHEQEDFLLAEVQEELLEEQAREKYHYVAPGEVFFKI